MTDAIEPKTLQSRVIETKLLNWRTFQFIQEASFKDLSPSAEKKLRDSILQNNFTQPFYVWHDATSGINYCLDGFHRIKVLKDLQAEATGIGQMVPEELPATLIHCNDKQEAAKLVLIYSSMYAKITESGLFDFMEAYQLDMDEMKMTVDLPGFDQVTFEGIFSKGDEVEKVIPRTLTERFIIPPFSIFDSRQGYWQERKKQWHALGFDSQETRENVELIAQSGQSPAIYALRNTMRETLKREPSWDEIIAYASSKGMHLYSGASIFDPVLAEICYKWFCPEGGSILDSFAGGSVRGIVAGILDYNYLGIDLRKEQVDANRHQWLKIPGLKHDEVNWLTGDSNVVLDELYNKFDFLFSCPPYHDLEQYSDDPADLSNMDYLKEFIPTYRGIIHKSVQRLKDNRFACFVVGDIRDKEGFYRDFVGDTVQAFRDAGAAFYNEIILINVAGSLPVRVGRQFESGRKVGKMHQNVLVFYKGDPKKIKEEFPTIKVEEYLQGLDDQPNIALSESY